MYVNQIFISKMVANRLNDILLSNGGPTEDRILILSPKDDAKVGGIIVPDSAKETLPRKGVVVLKGHISEAYKYLESSLNVGDIVTYGRYAGKEIEFDPNLFEKGGLAINLEKNTFTVLSSNELIYIEHNNN